MSKVSAAKLIDLLLARKGASRMRAAEVLQSIEPTLEGIVRDLVGKILLETVVANALDQAQVTYLREGQYKHLMGVVYSFRADFVVPNADQPKAFIEVRKSSSRHASLYAKDKMFSAINWKGRNKELLAVLVAEGPWTSETLRVLANVFDYVVPLSRSLEVAEAIAAYSKGDRSKLKWIIEFKITAADSAPAS